MATMKAIYDDALLNLLPGRKLLITCVNKSDMYSKRRGLHNCKMNYAKRIGYDDSLSIYGGQDQETSEYYVIIEKSTPSKPVIFYINEDGTTEPYLNPKEREVERMTQEVDMSEERKEEKRDDDSKNKGFNYDKWVEKGIVVNAQCSMLYV